MTAQKFFTACVFLTLSLPLVQMASHLLPRQPLYGVQVKAHPPVLSAADILHRHFQAGLEDWFNQNYGLQDDLVKTNHQLYFSLFGVVKNAEGIILGKEGQLLNDHFTRESLQFNPPVDFGLVVKKIARVRDLFRARGKTFFLIITPTKSSTYPAYTPDAYLRFPHFDPGLNRRNFTAALTKARVPFLDAQRLISKQAKEDDTPLFPRGGIHWNSYSSALAARELLAGIQKASGKPIGIIHVGPVTQDDKKEEGDSDYAYLLNLWSPPLDYGGVHVKPRVVPGPFWGRMTLALQGGSFTTRLFAYFYDLGLFKRPVRLWYHQGYYDTPRGPLKGMDEAFWKERVLNADIFALEINEMYLNTPDPAVFPDGFLPDLLERLEKEAQDRKAPTKIKNKNNLKHQGALVVK